MRRCLPFVRSVNSIRSADPVGLYVSAVSQQPDDDEVLPQRGADDTDTGWGDEQATNPDEDVRRYDEDRPPHWEP